MHVVEETQTRNHPISLCEVCCWFKVVGATLYLICEPCVRLIIDGNSNPAKSDNQLVA